MQVIDGFLRASMVSASDLLEGELFAGACPISTLAKIIWLPIQDVLDILICECRARIIAGISMMDHALR
ncbi:MULTISPECIES: hypothetical protein [unclassified Corynebacterium]|uniref:hypothetical protein n=1 Tax=unclassified Corynebacterium TaxID=2624378 RepID=UPI0029CA29DB|nr:MULTISPECIES: hypothetical protein [unclassified Corynebacterium]WPF66264.1 hypothetical protein OLX12_00595 [Corynebacterium sp. 22KM0430]WPF68754.1 hypothetical protein OLW90_00595 [Corynebacterium sp. 21KM1197]